MRPEYHLTRFAILRLLGLVYLGAFASALGQIIPLIGHDGLLPADEFLSRVREHYGSGALWKAPSLFWWSASDTALEVVAITGVALSVLVLAGVTHAGVMFALWVLYLSIVHVGQVWYGYGWETQLLETGFLAISLCPLKELRPFPRDPPPLLVIFLFRWLAVRIMLGAGLIKLRGDPCWRDLTCLYYHFETQPIPNPLSRIFHFAPHWVHQTGTVFNHITELIAPLFAFGPRLARHVAGGLMLSFQIVLITSGNLSFLNWLTMVPILACFDDGVYRRILPKSWGPKREPGEPSRARTAVVAVLVAVVAFLSIDPIMNLLSPHQAMNTSYDPLALVNSYGAFGSVGKARDEIILEGTRDETITSSTTWVAYEFPCKPGDPSRRPCVAGLYQRRLDWQIWFAAMGSIEDEPWMLHLVYQLLNQDRALLGLFDKDPFPQGPPRFIRAELYGYRFAPMGDPQWWIREDKGEWLPPLSKDDPRLLQAMEGMGWRISDQ